MFEMFKKKEAAVSVSDDVIAAPADGELFPIESVKDEVFAQKMMGDGVAFRYSQDHVVLCAPCNGVLSVLFPTGHAFGITMNNGVEVLVHIGIDTVNAKGDGFRLLKKKQGDMVKAGDPIVEADIRKLGQTYDMSTMLIITDNHDHKISFIDPCTVTKGQSLLKQ
ncbi:MAG: PTS glucose transporter subunit IIA [Solobacterium sp.]|jgi:PTS system glucose-specific IIA component|nr:PTS glucose transporter subunit IIA [Solobacterium sp.]MCH4205595.1 PTS glucose transporter subunit IIA [Solobacterium sp.]MCH4227070.1 PTS glucose transporter subunit IIA [Solobacterium sp.]MCH4282358.1 PTS glucose transporter subunit IIA [Solobacterium sp.]